MPLSYLGNAPKKYLPGTYLDGYLASSGALVGVTRDAASGKYFPASASEWNTVFAAAGVGVTFAGNIWLCQEASGNLADSGGAGLSLTATGTPSYQQAVTGYTRLKVSNATDGNANNRFTATGTDILTNSNLLFGVFDMPTANPAAARTFLGLGANATRAAAEFLTTGLLRGRSVGNVNDGTDCKNAVRPLMLQADRTNNLVRALDDVDKTTPTFDATMAGTLINIWGYAGANLTPACGTLYLTRLTGSAAEMTDAQKKAVLVTLGWSISWT